jgi:hypothetical protein
MRVLNPRASYSLMGSNILLSNMFSNTISLCSSLNVRDQVSHQFKTGGRIMLLHVLIFLLLNNLLEDKRL